MKASNIKFVYFIHPVQIRMKNSVKPLHVVSNDRFRLDMKPTYLQIEIDNMLTLVPLHNISSIQIEGATEEGV